MQGDVVVNKINFEYGFAADGDNSIIVLNGCDEPPEVEFPVDQNPY